MCDPYCYFLPSQCPQSLFNLSLHIHQIVFVQLTDECHDRIQHVLAPSTRVLGGAEALTGRAPAGQTYKQLQMNLVLVQAWVVTEACVKHSCGQGPSLGTVCVLGRLQGCHPVSKQRVKARLSQLSNSVKEVLTTSCASESAV